MTLANPGTMPDEVKLDVPAEAPDWVPARYRRPVRWFVEAGALAWARDLVRRLDARSLLVWGLVRWTAVPVAWLVGNAGRWQQVTPDLVMKNPWPHVLAAAGLLLLVVGVIRQETGRRSGRLAADA